jgi:hypothetical protein
MKARLGTPEQQKAVNEWRSQIGQALVDNLNRNVLRKNEPAPYRRVRPAFVWAYLLTLAAVGATLVVLPNWR